MEALYTGLALTHLKMGGTDLQINKILNNNVVVTSDAKNNELIVMGKGLAFQKKIGDKIDVEKVDKKYRLSDSQMLDRFQDLLQDVPVSYFEVAGDIVAAAKEQLTPDLNDSIYFTLTDHLHTAIQRIKEGTRVKNFLLWDIKRFYPKEYEIGQQAVVYIKTKYRLDLMDDEAGFIALHLVNGQIDSGNENAYELTELMQEIVKITGYYFKVQFDETSVYFERFITHLRYFVSRILSGKQHTEDTDVELLEIIQMKYHNAYQCVLKISEYIYDRYMYKVSNDEKLYLTIHIARLVQKTTK